MAERTTYPVRCACGHEGAIRKIENDQPYSASYEAYSPVDLQGIRVEFKGFGRWPDVLAAMALSCPSCGADITLENIVMQP